jgi:His/Glu/Gln/Arg/opine family amino acid ABC transporter permease subunit
MVSFISRYWDTYLIGLALSIVISLAAIALTISLGLVLALSRQSSLRLVRAIAGSYVAIFRALPPLLTLYFVFFALPTWAAHAEIPVLSTVLDSASACGRILATPHGVLFSVTARTRRP